jgi:hypothetical protein
MASLFCMARQMRLGVRIKCKTFYRSVFFWSALFSLCCFLENLSLNGFIGAGTPQGTAFLVSIDSLTHLFFFTTMAMVLVYCRNMVSDLDPQYDFSTFSAEDDNAGKKKRWQAFVAFNVLIYTITIVLLAVYAPYDTPLSSHSERSLYIRALVWYDIFFAVLWFLLSIGSLIFVVQLSVRHQGVLPRAYFCLVPFVPLCLLARTAAFLYAFLVTSKSVDAPAMDTAVFEFIDEFVGELIPLGIVLVLLLCGKTNSITQTMEGLSMI